MEIIEPICYNEFDYQPDKIHRGGVFVAKKTIAAVLSLILLLALLPSCSDDDGSVTVYYTVTDSVNHMDPQIASDTTDKILVTNCFEGLVTLDSDGNIIPGMAESYTISDDGLVYTFYLREDSYWHVTNTASSALESLLPDDFAPQVTADDFIFALRRAVDPDTSAPDSSLLAAIGNATSILNGEAEPETLAVEKLDDFTLVITLDYAYADFLSILALPIAMPCNEEFFEATNGRYGLSLEYMLCNGPFYLYRVSDSSVYIVRNPEYYGYEDVIPDSVYLVILDDSETAAGYIKDSTYDAGLFEAEIYFEYFYDRTDFTGTSMPGYVWCYCFNANDEVMTNDSVRIAAASLCDISYMTGYSEMYEATDTLLSELLRPYYDFSPTLLTMTQDDAYELFTAGLTELEELEEPVEVEYLTVVTTEEFASQVRKQIQLWQSALSIDVKLETVETVSELEELVESGEYQIAFCPLEYSVGSVSEFLATFSQAASSVIGFSSEEFDTLLETLATAASSDETTEILVELEQMIIDSGCVVPYLTQSSYFVLGKGVSGVYALSASQIFFKYGDVSS